MRKALIIVGLTIILSLALVGIASANAGPHGGYSNTTDGCAGCHRAHTAIGGPLLVKTSIYALCTTCHGSSGSGANTDVLDGLFIERGGYAGKGTSGAMLNGGGFLYLGGTVPADPTDAVAPATETTSAHNVDGMPARGYVAGAGDDGQTAPAWGGGTAVGLAWDGAWPAGSNVKLECTSCHNPHGSTNYRILNDYTYSKSYAGGTYASWYGSRPYYGATEWQLEAGANQFQDFQVLSTPSDTGTSRYTNWATFGGATSKAIGGNYTVGMNTFCASCHQRYNTATDSPHDTPNKFVPVAPYTVASYPEFGTDAYGYDAGDGNGSVARYRHRVGYSYGGYNMTLMPVRFAVTDNATVDRSTGAATFNYTGATDSNYVTCLTCHFAHGTTAAQSGYAVKSLGAGGVWQDNPSQVGGVAKGVAPANDSALLFYDNRGVCQNCHKKTSVNFNNN